MNENEIKKYFTGRELDLEAQNYLNFHAQRYEILLGKLKEIKSLKPKAILEILDIGPSFFTELLIVNFKNDSISALGFSVEDKYRGGHLPASINLGNLKKFYEFDLNQSADGKIQEATKFDIMVLAEVLEHLQISPEAVLFFLKELLAENGYLIIQTPNAVAIDKRVAMLRGINPFEKIRQDSFNPGHFREYTPKELLGDVKQVGFSVIELDYYNNPAPKPESLAGKFLDIFLKASKKVFPGLGDGMTLVCRK